MLDVAIVFFCLAVCGWYYHVEHINDRHRYGLDEEPKERQGSSLDEGLDEYRAERAEEQERIEKLAVKALIEKLAADKRL